MRAIIAIETGPEDLLYSAELQAAIMQARRVLRLARRYNDRLRRQYGRPCPASAVTVTQSEREAA
jgi:hypothetical protein